MDARREARKIGRQLRDEFRARGEFTQTAFRRELGERLGHLQDDAYDGFVDKVAQEIDEEATKDRNESLLPGFDLDGEYRCGDNVRVAKRLARLDHALMAMKLDDANLVAVMAANMRKHEELARLQPYWGPGMTKEEAVRACGEAGAGAA